MTQKVCELISSHGTALVFEDDANYIFIAFNNTEMFIKTDTDKKCKVKSIYWKKQWKWAFVAPKHPVYIDNTTMDRYVCKAIVGDN